MDKLKIFYYNNFVSSEEVYNENNINQKFYNKFGSKIDKITDLYKNKLFESNRK